MAVVVYAPSIAIAQGIVSNLIDSIITEILISGRLKNGNIEYLIELFHFSNVFWG